MRFVVQIAGAIAVALGIGLFVYGQFSVPEALNVPTVPQLSPGLRHQLDVEFRDAQQQSSRFRGFGAGFFTFGVLVIALSFMKPSHSVGKVEPVA